MSAPGYLDGDSGWERITTVRSGYAILISDRIHLPAGRKSTEGLAFTTALRLEAAFLVHIGFLTVTDTERIVGEDGDDLKTELRVTEIGESGTRDGVEREESAGGDSSKAPGRISSFILRSTSGFPTARS